MLKAIAIGLFCFILFLLSHIIIFHFWQINKRFKVITTLFYSIIPVYIFIYLIVPPDTLSVLPADPLRTTKATLIVSSAINFISGFMLYVFLFLGYCQFYFIVDRSISVRIMIELENTDEKKMTANQIKQVYSPDGIFTRRLGHMVDGGYLTENNGYYENTKKGHLEARVFKFLKEFLNLGVGG